VDTSFFLLILLCGASYLRTIYVRGAQAQPEWNVNVNVNVIQDRPIP